MDSVFDLLKWAKRLRESTGRQFCEVPSSLPHEGNDCSCCNSGLYSSIWSRQNLVYSRFLVDVLYQAIPKVPCKIRDLLSLAPWQKGTGEHHHALSVPTPSSIQSSNVSINVRQSLHRPKLGYWMQESYNHEVKRWEKQEAMNTDD